LANAAGVPLAESAQIVTESLNQFGASAKDTARFVNVLAAGSKFGASEVAETGTAIVRAGVAAKLASLSFEDTNAALQILAKNGIKSERAGTQLKTVLIRLESLTSKKYKPSIVGLDKALENLNKRNLSTNQLTKLFGREAISVGEILISNRDLVAKMRDDITGTGIATEQAGIRLGTFSAKIRGIGISINEVFIRIFSKIADNESVFGMLDNFKDWLDGLDSSNLNILAETIALVATSLGKLGSVAADIAAFVFKPIRNFLAFSLDLVDAFDEKIPSFTRTRAIFKPEEIIDIDELSVSKLEDIRNEFRKIKKEKQLVLSRGDVEGSPLLAP
jgi:TP901 family phage tail tape measure protein